MNERREDPAGRIRVLATALGQQIAPERAAELAAALDDYLALVRALRDADVYRQDTVSDSPGRTGDG